MNTARFFGGVFFLLLFCAACSTSTVQRHPRHGAGPGGWPVPEGKEGFDSFAPLRPRLGVLPFDSPPELADTGVGVAAEATKDLLNELARSEKFVLAQREARAAFPGGSSAVFSGEEVMAEQAQRRARDAGLTLLLFGKIRRAAVRTQKDDVGILRSSKSAALAEVDFHVMDVRSGKIILSRTLREDTTDRQTRLFGNEEVSPDYRFDLMREAARRAVYRFVPELVRSSERLGWQGRIAKIVGTRVYVNAGRATGIQVGDILRVSSKGQDVYDPDTGAYLGKAEGPQKATLEVVDYFGDDGAIARLHSGGHVHEGDLVELY